MATVQPRGIVTQLQLLLLVGLIVPPGRNRRSVSLCRAVLPVTSLLNTVNTRNSHPPEPRNAIHDTYLLTTLNKERTPAAISSWQIMLQLRARKTGLLSVGRLSHAFRRLLVFANDAKRVQLREKKREKKQGTSLGQGIAIAIGSTMIELC